MKNVWIIGIVVAWTIISIIGMLSWECRADMYQGIALSLGICVAVYSFSMSMTSMATIEEIIKRRGYKASFFVYERIISYIRKKNNSYNEK